VAFVTTQSASAATSAVPRSYERCSDLGQRYYVRSSGSVSWATIPVSDMARGPAEVNAGRSRTMTTSVSGSVGLDYLSRSLGFSVQREWSSEVNSGVSYHIDPGMWGRVVMQVLRYQGQGSYMVCESYGIDGFHWFGPVTYSYNTYSKNSKYYEGQQSSRPGGPWQAIG
jgi:hypothetical protein